MHIWVPDHGIPTFKIVLRYAPLESHYLLHVIRVLCYVTLLLTIVGVASIRHLAINQVLESLVYAAL